MNTVWFIIFCSFITIGCAFSTSKKKSFKGDLS